MQEEREREEERDRDRDREKVGEVGGGGAEWETESGRTEPPLYLPLLSLSSSLSVSYRISLSYSTERRKSGRTGPPPYLPIGPDRFLHGPLHRLEPGPPAPASARRCDCACTPNGRRAPPLAALSRWLLCIFVGHIRSAQVFASGCSVGVDFCKLSTL